MSGVAEAERWVGAILTVFFGVFYCTIIARNAIRHWDDGFGQFSLSTLN
jgi:uncharacterized membrane protein